jgi:hypothetical protein
MKAIVDTNVPIVANERGCSHVSPECVQECVDRILKLTRNGVLVIDDKWLIIEEYSHKLYSTGQPGVGDMFLKWVLTNRENPDKCQKVPITSCGNSFEEYPSDPQLQSIKYDDRKFIALAFTHPERPPIWQAVDTQWWTLRDVFEKNKIEVDFLCPKDMMRLSS